MKIKHPWKPRFPHVYSLNPKGFRNFHFKFHQTMSLLSDDPVIRAKQQINKGLYHPRIEELRRKPPKQYFYDILGRVILHGNAVILTHKLDKLPLQVLCYRGKDLILV